MKIQTVTGQISPNSLGTTLPHEHLLIDVSCRHRETSDPYLMTIANMPVDFSIVDDLRRNPTISIDSLRLTDSNLAIEELMRYKLAGGVSLVDQTSHPLIGRDPIALRRISQTTGINIIAGCGYYSPVLPEKVGDLSVEQLTEEILFEAVRGIDGTHVKPGLIGEIGTSWPVTPTEVKILRAAARAQIRSGLSLSIHPSPWDKCALTLLDIVQSEGSDLRKVVICHLDHLMDLEYHKAVAKRGAYVEYDRFGVEWYSSQEALRFFPRDTERVYGVIELVRAGYLHQILISHDICQKIELKKYGGPGYSHVLRYVVPMMKKMGMCEEDIHTLLVENPMNMLCF